MAKESSQQAPKDSEKPAARPADIELKTKLSVKAIVGRPKRPSENDKPRALCSIMGIIRGLKKGDGANGPWLGFTGDFEGVSHEDGRIVRAAELFVPKSAEGVLVQAYTDASKPDSEGNTPIGVSIQFALEIGIKYAENQFGYEYIVKPLIKSSENDPLASLRAAVMPLLPAPKVVSVEA